jgi:hypothetical protein
MDIQKLRVIPKPPEGTRMVLDLSRGVSLVLSEGDTNITCGNCATALLRNINPTRINFKNMVFYCDWCGSYNELPQIQ